MKFAVTYTETLSKTYIVEAEDRWDAEAIVYHLVDEEYIVLDADDFVSGDYSSEVADPDDIKFFDDVDDEFPYAMEDYREMMEENC